MREARRARNEEICRKFRRFFRNRKAAMRFAFPVHRIKKFLCPRGMRQKRHAFANEQCRLIAQHVLMLIRYTLNLGLLLRNVYSLANLFIMAALIQRFNIATGFQKILRQKSQ